LNMPFLVFASFVSLTIISAVGKNDRLKVPEYSLPANENPMDALSASPSFTAPVDTPPPTNTNNNIDLHYPIYDRVTDFLTTPNENSLDLQDPAIIQKDIEYDPETKEYNITETI